MTASVQTYWCHHCKTHLDRNIILTHNAGGPLSHTGAFSMMATVKIEDSVYRSTHADHHSCPCVDAAIRKPLRERNGIVEQQSKTEMQRDRLSPKYPAYYLIGICVARFDCGALAMSPA